MPPRNTNPLPGKMPNGQDKETYTRLCHEFIEHNYKRLLNYAMYRTKGDKDRAAELLHRTMMILLEGWYDIDFTYSPYAYVQIMIKQENTRHRDIKQRNFEYTYMTPSDPHEMAKIQYCTEDLPYTDIDFLLEHFQELRRVLNQSELMHLEWFLDGLSYEEMIKKHHVSKTRIGQILTSARKKIRKKGLALLQVV